MIRFVGVFFGVLIPLFLAELWQPVQDSVVLPLSSLIAKVVATVLIPLDRTIIANGKVLVNSVTGVGVSIEPGCNGVEACLILTAGICAYPASWSMRLAGIGLGFAAIQAVNLLRVISLYYLLGYSEPLFKFVHLYLWQALIMVDVLVVWLVWMSQVARRKARNAIATR